MTPLLGRDRALEMIEAFLVTPPGGEVLAFHGAAGFGKTALLNAAVERAAAGNWCVLRAQPSESENELGFGLLADLLEPVLERANGALSPPQRHALDVALRRVDSNGTAVDPLSLGLAVLGTLRAAAVEQPVVLAIDDLQWADRPSTRALEFALRRLEGDRIVLLITSRSSTPSWLPLPSRTITVEVGPLELEPFATLVRKRVGGSLHRSLLRQLHDVCRGNPLHGIEVAALLRDRAYSGDGREPLPVPSSISETVGARIAELERGVRDFLLVAAAHRRPTRSLVESALGRNVDEEADCAAAAGVVSFDDDRIVFSHPLVASAVYRTASRRQRREAHGRLGAALEDVEERAPHLALACNGSDPEVAAALDEAAASAAGRGALDSAGRLLELAAQATPGDRPVVSRNRLLEAARRHFAAGNTPRAHALLTELAPSSTTGAERSAILLELARTTENDVATCLAHARAALAEAAGEPRLQIAIHHYLIEILYGLGDAETAAEHAYAAHAIATALGDERVLALSVARVANADDFRGRPIRLDELEAAVETERRLGSAGPLENSPIVILAGYALRVGDHARARELELELLARATARGDDRARAESLGGLAELERAAGNLVLARSHAAEVAELGEQLGDMAFRSYGLMVQGATLALLGELDEAEELALAAQAVANEAEIVPFVAIAEHTLGVVALTRGEARRALEHFTTAEQMLDATGIADPNYRPFPLRIEALLALGELDETETCLDLVEQRCTVERHPRVLAVAARLRGMLASLRGDHAAAEAAFGDAIALQERAPSPYALARTRLAQGTARRRRKRKRDARQSLEEAIELFESVGATLWADRARSELQSVGLRRSSGDELTPMEQRVAEAVAVGATNREVAAGLFLSDKTVEFHLRGVYRKLGVRSRTELAHRFAQRQGRENVG